MTRYDLILTLARIFTLKEVILAGTNFDENLLWRMELSFNFDENQLCRMTA